MFKKAIFAAAAITAAVFVAQPAQAGTNFSFGFGIGVPNVTGPVYAEPVYMPAYTAPRRISCHHARSIVRGHGFHHVKALDCSGSRYKFRGKRGGVYRIIKMRSRNGHIYSIH